MIYFEIHVRMVGYVYSLVHNNYCYGFDKYDYDCQTDLIVYYVVVAVGYHGDLSVCNCNFVVDS